MADGMTFFRGLRKLACVVIAWQVPPCEGYRVPLQQLDSDRRTPGSQTSPQDRAVSKN
ncbi:MAG: hypothetical protein HYT76_04145 [Deltaproteobacteria bacterium]|nr:hypothetical protein [Deltaproteobacteria bacterium]